MRKKIVQFTALSLSLVMLSGCGNINKQDIGMATGGIAGGLLGSQFGGGTGRLVAIGAGTLAGAFIGGAIGKNMDEGDKLKAERALENTPTGKAVSWHNPDNGKRYTVKPTRTYHHQNQPCREYTMTANVAGKTQTVYGTACREADGSWKTKS